METVLAAARDAGCGAAEIFVKEGRGRQVTLEPSSPGEPPTRQVSHTREAGAALRVVDPAGRGGFAWVNLGDPVEPATLVGAALHAAGLGPVAGAAGTGAPAAGAPMNGTPPAASGNGPEAAAGGVDPGLVDATILKTGDDEVIARLQEGVAEVTRLGEAVLEVDRIVLAEAATTIRLATSAGLRGAFDRTLAMLSIALVPAAPEARAVVEERLTCRLAELDLAECAREAVLRGLPERDATGDAATGAAVDLVLAPRAAASLIAALAPAALSGTLPDIRRPSALVLHDDATVAGRPSSAPFDGAGRPTGRRILVEGGRPPGRFEVAGGHFERPSYRDLPRPGPAALVVAPGVKVADPFPGGGIAARGQVVVIRAAIVDIRPGTEWVVRIRRGDLWKEGERLGPADGLVWEGDLARLIQAIVDSGDDSRWYQCGLAVGSPSLTLRGLSPWRRDAQPGS